MLVFGAILILTLDIYIFFALRGSSILLTKNKWFALLWWGYNTILVTGLFITLRSDILFDYRSGIVIIFIITTICKFSFGLVLIIDDIRRGGMWIFRLLFPKKETERLTGQPIGNKQKHAITR